MKKDLVLVVDMYGCPNRCKHCWLGHMPNKTMDDNIDIFLIDYFKNSFENIEYYSWLREPDYCDDYKKRWDRDNEISINKKPIRFELASFYRLNRDQNYVRFLKDIGVNDVQLTLFGLEEKTDFYIGRKGAFSEIINASEILIRNNIAPRFQIFINEDNKDEIEQLIDYIKGLNIEKRVEAFGKKFEFFINIGSCDGENANLYDVRINMRNISEKIKKYIVFYDDLRSERELAELLKNDNGYFIPKNNNKIVLNISNTLDVYYNFTHMREEWKIGNIGNDNKNELITNIINENTFALNVARKFTISDLVNEYADFKSDRAFEREDYLYYLLNKKVRSEYEKKKIN